MKVMIVMLYIAAIIFGIMGVVGHTSALAAATICFFAASMIIIGQHQDK